MGTSPGVDTPAARWFKTLSQRLNQQGISLKLVNASGMVRDRLRAEDLEPLVGNFRRLDTINSIIAEFNSQRHIDSP
jgi:MFS superfamily sulfate permease-like transporter